MNPTKLKVVELRAELASRGLDTKGNKAVLIERLQEALDGESGKGSGDTSVSETGPLDPANSTQDTSVYLDATANEPSPQKEVAGDESEVESSQEVAKPPQPPSKENEPQKEPEKVVPTEAPPSQPSPVKESPKKEVGKAKEESVPPVEEMEVDVKPEVEKNKESPKKTGYEDAPMIDMDDIKKEKSTEVDKAKIDIQEGSQKAKTGSNQAEVNQGLKTEEEIKKEEPPTTGWENRRGEDRKRKRSPSPQRRTHSPARVKEEEPDLDETAVTLSWYDSDLNLIIEKDSFLKASPMSDAGFGYIWAGARSTYGYQKGKICYQVKLLENCDVSHLEDEPTPNVLRVGWSALGTSQQLGEEPLSYGYGGTGKVCVNCKFQNYGKPFSINDVLTCYLEFTDSEAIISYSLNKDYQGVAYRINTSDLGERALTPHILTKNIKYEVFMGKGQPWYPPQSDYTWAAEVQLEERVKGPQRPQKRSECEMIMMCGLPGCGKTIWANEHSKEHPDKLYNIIGTNALIEKMKVMGLPRKGNYSGRWDILIEKCTKCLQRLMELGSHRRRNYILDQTNVYPAAQRRKMRNFEGFVRKAVVIVPTDEEFKRRVEKRELEEGKDVPDSAVLEMKANFTLPDKSLFDEIIYTELADGDARPLVEKYNKEGIAAGHVRRGPQPGGGISGTGRDAKRFRSDYQPQRPRFDNYRRGPPMQPGGGGFRRGGGPPPPGRGGWQQRGGPDRGGWRDRNQGGGSMGGGGGYRAPPMGGGDRGMNRMGGGGWRGGGGGGNSSSSGGSRGGSRASDFGSDRNRSGERSSRGPPNSSGSGGRSAGGSQSSGYDRRDNRDNSRQKIMSGSGCQSGGSGGSVGSSGGNISAAGGGGSGGGSGGQWNQYPQQQGGNSQQWGGGGGGGGGQQNWGHQWGNYQQQWKGYNQGGYNQQGGGGGGGYNQQGYGSQQQGYGNWQQQYSYPNYGQNWPQGWTNWYGTTAQQQAGMTQSTNTSQPPPK